MRYPRPLLYLACLTFWLVSLLNLNRFPVIHQDEPWILSPGYKLFTQGIYGSDFFTGFYGMDRHYLQFMPLMSVLEGAATRMAGVGLFQLRFATVALGLVMLALVSRVGRQVASPQVSALAVLLLLTWQWTDGGGRALGTGIPLVDLARIARYDLLATVLGVAGFSVYLAARREGNVSLYLGTGLLIGLAGLAHLYGLLWLAPLALLELPARGRLGRLVAVGVGMLVAWLPWLLFLASNWSDYVWQVYPDRTRYSVFDPSFYVSNLLAEPQRYHFDLQLAGTWLLLAGLPLAWLWLLVDSVRHKKQHGFALAIVALGLPVLFALLLVQKTFNYLLTLVPIAALVFSVGLAWLFASRVMILRAGVALLLLSNAGQGVFAILQMQQRAAHIEPAEVELAQLHAFIPAAARVLGHPQYALAFDLAEYRSFLLVFDFSDPEANREPLSMYAALERIAPDYILYDPAMEAVFSDQSTALHEVWDDDFQRFLQRHHACVVSTVYDQEHNAVRIYQLNVQVPTSRLSHLMPSLP
jgi:hypothetical protein